MREFWESFNDMEAKIADIRTTEAQCARKAEIMLKLTRHRPPSPDHVRISMDQNY